MSLRTITLAALAALAAAEPIATSAISASEAKPTSAAVAVTPDAGPACTFQAFSGNKCDGECIANDNRHSFRLSGCGGRDQTLVLWSGLNCGGTSFKGRTSWTPNVCQNVNIGTNWRSTALFAEQ